MPELDTYYPGDELKLSNYPHLKNIVQTGHKNIRGTIKFKDSLVYANTRLNPFSLPTNESSMQLFECYRGGKKVASHTSGDIADKAADLWSNNFSKSSGDKIDGKMFNYEFNSG